MTGGEGTIRELDVPEGEDGTRLDRFVTAALRGWTRSAVRRLIDDGRVWIDGECAPKAGVRLDGGETVEVDLPAPVPERPLPEDIPLAIVFEDDDLVVVDKPAGLVVHPGHGNRTGTLVNALLGRGTPLAPVGAPDRPGIVHRLDRDTSGVLVVAKTARAHRALAAQFAERRVVKIYHALVWGRPAPPEGTVDRAIGRDPRDRTRMRAGAPGGRRAVTHYRTLEAPTGFAWLEIRLETGRTHQIRVHLASIGHAVVGDERYGGKRVKGVQDPVRRAALAAFERHALHASRLEIAHPSTGETLRLSAPVPADVATLLDALRSVP